MSGCPFLGGCSWSVEPMMSLRTPQFSAQGATWEAPQCHHTKCRASENVRLKGHVVLALQKVKLKIIGYQYWIILVQTCLKY
jgi:hypothetical protein